MRIYLGLNIKHLRKMHQVTQNELAERLGKSHTTIVNYEKGEQLPPLDVILEMVKLFRVSLEDFVLRDLTLKETLDEKMAGFDMERKQDWQFIAQQLGKSLRELQEQVRVGCPDLWDKLDS